MLSILKLIGITSLGTLTSRILGFIRDLLSASILGANVYSDIFFVAFKFPNLFRRIFAEGAFTQSFLPSFVKAKNKPAFAWLVFKKLFIIILILSLIVTLFSNLITDLLAPGFSEEVKKLASPLVAINFWYLDLIFIVTFFSSLLQHKKQVFMSAFTPVLLNIAFIIALLISKDLPKEQIIWYLSLGVIFGGIAQVLAILYSAKKHNVLKLLCIGTKSKKQEDLSTFKKHFLPSIFGNSTSQISSFIDTWLATFLASGSISYLWYANRLFQLPFALFALATSSVIFPEINKRLNKNQHKEAFEILKKMFWILFYILTLATIVAIISSKEIITLLFEHGAFTKQDTLYTSVTLIMYMIGLIPAGLNKLLSSYLFATHRHLKAAKISAISLGVNIFFSLALIMPLKFYGLALATSIGEIIKLFLIIKEFGFDKFIKFFEKKYIFYTILIILASIILAVVFKNLILLIT